MCFETLVYITSELEKELIAAAVHGRTEEVIRLLDVGVNIDVADEVRNVCMQSM